MSSTDISNTTKLKVYENIPSHILSLFMYNSETWTLNKQHRKTDYGYLKCPV